MKNSALVISSLLMLSIMTPASADETGIGEPFYTSSSTAIAPDETGIGSDNMSQTTAFDETGIGSGEGMLLDYVRFLFIIS